MIEVDGNYLEGGGQIIRTAIALSVITKKSVHIFNIRKGRKNPGLRPQHLEAITSVATTCGASVDGLRIQSQNLTFCPGQIHGGSYTIDTRTAGSVTLVMQTLLPIAAFSDLAFRWVVKGGTAVPFSPSITYFQDVFCFYLRLMGVPVSVHLNKHGFYPAGGGEIAVSVKPSRIKNIEMIERGRLDKIRVFSYASFHLKEKRVAERMADGFREIIPEANFETSYVSSLSPGCFVTGLAIYNNSCRMGACALGEIRKRAEDVGRDAARHLKDGDDSEAVIDYWMVDQIIPYMALAVIKTGLPSKIKIPSLTGHGETNIWVVKIFLPVEFKIQNNIMECFKRSSEN
ncbi:MAG: RNA 3'-terminal phosphate cyclase [bacterium]